MFKNLWKRVLRKHTILLTGFINRLILKQASMRQNLRRPKAYSLVSDRQKIQHNESFCGEAKCL